MKNTIDQVMKNQNNPVDLEDPKTYQHFKHCPLCEWDFDPEFFDAHECKQMLEDMKNGGDKLPQELPTNKPL